MSSSSNNHRDDEQQQGQRQIQKQKQTGKNKPERQVIISDDNKSPNDVDELNNSRSRISLPPLAGATRAPSSKLLQGSIGSHHHTSTGQPSDESHTAPNDREFNSKTVRSSTSRPNLAEKQQQSSSNVDRRRQQSSHSQRANNRGREPMSRSSSDDELLQQQEKQQQRRGGQRENLPKRQMRNEELRAQTAAARLDFGGARNAPSSALNLEIVGSVPSVSAAASSEAAAASNSTTQQQHAPSSKSSYRNNNEVVMLQPAASSRGAIAISRRILNVKQAARAALTTAKSSSSATLPQPPTAAAKRTFNTKSPSAAALSSSSTSSLSIPISKRSSQIANKEKLNNNNYQHHHHHRQLTTTTTAKNNNNSINSRHQLDQLSKQQIEHPNHLENLQPPKTTSFENNNNNNNNKMADQAVIDKLEAGYAKLQAATPEQCHSLLKKYLSRDVLDKLKAKKTAMGATLLDVAQSGFENLDSGVGIYAPDAESYTTFAELFNPIIQDYHGGFKATDKHPASDFGDLETLVNVDPANEYVISTRVRCGRSLQGYPFNPCLTEAQYKEMETKVTSAFKEMEGDLAGTYYPLTGMTKETQQQLIDDHFLFKEGDRFLQHANACRYWPTGRGIYHNSSKTFLVWVNEEDHLRIISMQKGGDLKEVFGRLVKGARAIEAKVPFSRDERLGFLTFCPTNLGTTIRASVHIKLPKLAADRKKLEEVAGRYNLQVRGTSGEHTESIGGIYDISNKRRLGLTEYQAVREMQDGILELIKIEKSL